MKILEVLRLFWCKAGLCWWLTLKGDIRPGGVHCDQRDGHGQHESLSRVKQGPVGSNRLSTLMLQNLKGEFHASTALTQNQIIWPGKMYPRTLHCFALRHQTASSHLNQWANSFFEKDFLWLTILCKSKRSSSVEIPLICCFWSAHFSQLDSSNYAEFKLTWITLTTEQCVVRLSAKKSQRSVSQNMKTKLLTHKS